MKDYVSRWFVTHDAFVRQAGEESGEIEALLATGAAPGVVYSETPSGDWWSALAAYSGSAPASPPPGGTDWYAPAAIWWIRRARLAMRNGATAAQAAAMNQDGFVRAFVTQLAREPLASLNYGHCFKDGIVSEAVAVISAKDEWRAWISGAYGVCLRLLTAESCIQKEALARRIRLHFEAASDADRLAPDILLEYAERLSGWVLPFSPMERPSGTPGRAIDQTLSVLDLGREEPFGLPSFEIHQ